MGSVCEGAPAKPLWHARPLYRNFDYKHPELQPGEVLLCNGTAKTFDGFLWETKRRGRTAYSIFGEDISSKFGEPWYPIFIQMEELERRGIDLVSQPVQ